jgi:cyanophycinase
MKSRIRLLLLLLSSCATYGDGQDLLRFCAMGDIPYTPFENQLLPLQLENLPKPIEFIVHLGDIKSGKVPCPRETYERVAVMLGKSRVPLFIVPGDNEWNDCPDPAAAWLLWMEHFNNFDKRWDTAFSVERDTIQPQSLAFVHNQVLFVGLFIVGGKVHDVEEWKTRHADSLTWLRAQMESHTETVTAAVVFAHARPFKTQQDFFDGFSEIATNFKKPVLYLHGDGHKWIKDQPFPAQNIQRVQVDQGRLGPPLLVTVSSDPKQPFRFDRRMEEQSMVRTYPVEGLTRGPGKGSLVIVGGAGGATRKNIFQRFLKLAGGKDAHIVVVPTASESGDKETVEHFMATYGAADKLKPASVTILHTSDPKEADTDAFIAPLTTATGVWFSGGRQWRIVDAYGGTKTEIAFREVLNRGGSIGGSSAGATIQGSFLARGDSKGNTIMIGDHQRGFAYLENSAIDQHVIARGRELDLITLLSDPEGQMNTPFDRTKLLGIGIDENNAIIVQKNTFSVVGNPFGGALVYDPSTWYAEQPEKEKYLLLGPGSRYDLFQRKVLKLNPPKPTPKKPIAEKAVPGGKK